MMTAQQEEPVKITHVLQALKMKENRIKCMIAPGIPTVQIPVITAALHRESAGSKQLQSAHLTLIAQKGTHAQGAHASLPQPSRNALTIQNAGKATNAGISGA